MNKYPEDENQKGRAAILLGEKMQKNENKKYIGTAEDHRITHLFFKKYDTNIYTLAHLLEANEVLFLDCNPFLHQILPLI